MVEHHFDDKDECCWVLVRRASSMTCHLNGLMMTYQREEVSFVSQRQVVILSA